VLHLELMYEVALRTIRRHPVDDIGVPPYESPTSRQWKRNNVHVCAPLVFTATKRRLGDAANEGFDALAAGGFRPLASVNQFSLDG